MYRVFLKHSADWEGWRRAARALAVAGVPEQDVSWSVGANVGTKLPETTGGFTAPRGLIDLAQSAIAARDPERYTLLYRLIRRARAGEDIAVDPDFIRVRNLALAVRRETHRMQSLLRFLPIRDSTGPVFAGWFEPAHFVQRAVAAAYARDFPYLPFSILTPDESAHWTGAALCQGPGVPSDEVTDDLTLEAAWRARCADLFAGVDPPARPNDPPASVLRAPDRPALGPVRLPDGASMVLTHVAEDAAGCQRCPLWQPATQTVFGEGSAGAAIMFIGEQPGDQEDIIGRPFVGPAGILLDRALEEAGIDRRQAYVTNAVKHFKFTPRGPRRLHQTPEAPEVATCHFWLDQERATVRPALIVLLGATAARAVLGRPVTIGRERGAPLDLPDGTPGLITVHPSFLLRQPDEDSRAQQYALFVRDLRQAAALAVRLR
jgi:probable DNA metabolism protein